MNRRKILSAAALTLTLGLTPAYAQVAAPATATQERLALTIADYLKFREGLSTMRAAVQSAPAYGRLLSAPGVYTLFAPTNDAFSQVTQTQLNAILSGRASLGHYLLRGTLTPEVLREMLLARGGQMTLPSLGGSPLAFTLDEGGNIIVGGVARIVASEVVGNGVVVPISNVVTAPVAVGEVGAEVGAGLGGAGAGAGTGLLTGRTISDALRLNENLETTRAAVNATYGLGRLLSRGGTYTLFAPTNDAYSQLAGPQLNALISGQADLEQWVVRGPLTAEALREMLLARGGQMSVETVGGGRLALALDEGGNVIVGGVARLLGTEVYANGVVAPVSAVLTAPLAAGAGVGEGAGVGAGIGGELGAALGQFNTYLGRAGEAIGAGDLGAFREAYGQAAGFLDRAVGLAEGDLREQLVGYREDFGAFGDVNDVGALREDFGAFRQEYGTFYNQLGVGAGAGIGTTAGVGVGGELGLEQNVGLFQDYLARTNEALAAGNFEEAQGYYDRAQRYLEDAIGVAEGPVRERLVGFQTRFNEIGGLSDRAALRERLGAFETEYNEFYESEFAE